MKAARRITLTLALGLGGCAEIRLREAMEQVQVRYEDLQQKLEAGSNFAARDASLALEQALEAPEISKRSPYAGNQEFEQLLREALTTTRNVRKVAQSFKREALSSLRGELTGRCEACHKVFRHP